MSSSRALNSEPESKKASLSQPERPSRSENSHKYNAMGTSIVEKGKPYNPFKCPPNMEKAELHGKVKKAGNILAVFDINDPNTKLMYDNIDELKQIKPNVCECCHKAEVFCRFT